MIGIISALKIEAEGLKALMENAEVTKKAGLEFADEEIRLMLPTKRYMEFTQVTGTGIRRIRLK